MEGRQTVEPKDAKPIVQRDEYAVIPDHQFTANHLFGVAGLVVAAVEEHQYRQVLRILRSVHIQVQAVLRSGCRSVLHLVGHLAGGGAVPCLCPGVRVLGRRPAQFTHGSRAVGDRVPNQGRSLCIRPDALHRAKLRLPDQRFVRLCGLCLFRVFRFLRVFRHGGFLLRFLPGVSRRGPAAAGRQRQGHQRGQYNGKILLHPFPLLYLLVRFSTAGQQALPSFSSIQYPAPVFNQSLLFVTRQTV